MDIDVAKARRVDLNAPMTRLLEMRAQIDS